MGTAHKHELWPRVHEFFGRLDPMDLAWAEQSVDLLESEAGVGIPVFTVHNFPYRVVAVAIAYQRFFDIARPWEISVPHPQSIFSLFLPTLRFNQAEFEAALTEFHGCLFNQYRNGFLKADSNAWVDAASVRAAMITDLLNATGTKLDLQDDLDQAILQELDEYIGRAFRSNFRSRRVTPTRIADK